MLLFELYHWRDGSDEVERARDISARLKRAGAEKEHKEEMEELDNAIDEYEEVLHADDRDREINGGMDTKAGYAFKHMIDRIQDMEYLVKASTGAGGTMAQQREEWAKKQEQDPLSRKIRAARSQLNDEVD